MRVGLVTAALVASGVTAALGADPALASALARQTSVQSVTSARWAAVVSAGTTATTTGPLALPLTVVNATGYLWVTNTGTTNLGSAPTSVTYSVAAAGVGVGSVQLRACTGTGASWNESNGTCVGGTVRLLASTGGGGAASAVVPAGPGSALRLQALGVSLTVAVTVTVSVSVTRR